jgi:hypothetical protein
MEVHKFPHGVTFRKGMPDKTTGKAYDYISG